MPISKAGARRSSPGKTARRWLYLTHRWIGIASCLLFAMWFLSGLVMIYVPYPSLSRAEKLAGAEAIDWARVTLPPPVDSTMPRHLVLEMRDGRPVWRIGGFDGTEQTVPASAHATLHVADAAFAGRVAGHFGHAPVRAVEQVERDQWTVSGGFDRHRPLWKASLADAAGTELYVSSQTGGVVQRTTRQARFWNWLGSVPHWLYPTVLRQDGALWRQVVMWVAGPGIAVALTGMWIGIIRARLGRRRFRGGRVTPYHGWMLWHHVAGLIGGVFLLTWIVSGWLSVDPGHLFAGREIDEQAMRRYAASAPLPPLDLQRMADAGRDARQVELTDFAARPMLTFSGADGSRDVHDAASLAPPPVEEARIAAAAATLIADGRLVATDRLEAPDAYWYEIGSRPHLPVLRLRFDDPAQTWLHVDPRTGEILGVMDSRRRTYRWLFDLLHKWDFNLLTAHRPAWDLLLWTLSIAGLIISVSGVWIGWRRLTVKSHRS